MKKEKRDDSFIKNPFYKGGAKAMNDFIYGSLKYPKEAAQIKVEGVVLIRYDIDHEGNVIDAKVIKGLGHGCDEEAIRVVKLLKFEVPKTPRKLKVIFHKDIKIYFKIAVQQTNPVLDKGLPTNQISVVYNIVPDIVKSEKAKEKTTTYSYSIKI